MSNEQNLISDLRDQNRALREENERLRKKSRLKLNAIGSDKCQINFTTPTVEVTISESEVKHRLAESELVVKMAGELTELQSQVDDLQEELSDTRAQSNLKDWEIRFLKEDVKRLTAKLYEKRHSRQTRDTED
jgi:peptidoglycan hydrolase CwlO-like protein